MNSPLNYDSLFNQLASSPVKSLIEPIRRSLLPKIENPDHGDFPKWQQAITQLPQLSTQSVNLNQSQVGATGANLSDSECSHLREQLMALHPWRKGPFNLHGAHIDTEWRSDWKWDRLAPHLSNLSGRTVLDIGTGSGYHAWRMRGAGAKLTIGIEPMLLYVMQFFAIKHFIGEQQTHVLPFGIEELPNTSLSFDTIFSMGVLYHRKNPIEHLEQIRTWLRPKGEFVLETLVVNGDATTALIPQGRYAQMRNVWFLPSTLMLEIWLKKCGFRNVRLVDENVTSLDEQRTTEWMTFQSLKDFLDPNDINKTAEGYPAPRRATFICEA